MFHGLFPVFSVFIQISMSEIRTENTIFSLRFLKELINATLFLHLLRTGKKRYTNEEFTFLHNAMKHKIFMSLNILTRFHRCKIESILTASWPGMAIPSYRNARGCRK